MSFEDDLSKFERQVNNFSIAGAAGNFHTGFSIGDDARGSGAGVHRARIGSAPEDRIAFLEQSFKNFTIRGGHDISVTGSLVAGGFAISAKQAPSGEVAGGGGGGGGPTPTGACCIGGVCHILTSADCATMGGTYQGDSAVCDPNPCAIGACCMPDTTCEILTSSACSDAGGSYQGDGTICSPNPCTLELGLHVHIDICFFFITNCCIISITGVYDGPTLAEYPVTATTTPVISFPGCEATVQADCDASPDITGPFLTFNASGNVDDGWDFGPATFHFPNWPASFAVGTATTLPPGSLTSQGTFHMPTPEFGSICPWNTIDSEGADVAVTFS